MRRLFLMALIALMLSAVAAQASPLAEGKAAYARGDYALALKTFQLLATQGDAEAQYSLAVFFENGRGVEPSSKEAAKWFLLAAIQGHASAQFNIGIRYYNGNGVLQDYEKAFKWSHLAAMQGNALGQNTLGLMYALGRGVDKDYVRAHMWLNLAGGAADTGDVKIRDVVEKKLTRQQIAEAHKLARECQERNFKDCG